MKKLRQVFKIILVRPEGADEADVRDYIMSALRSYRGGLQPPVGEYVGDPMWGLDVHSIRVVRHINYKRPKKRFNRQGRPFQHDAKR